MTSKPDQQAHICIVDDNQLAREIIIEQLSLEPYHVDQVASGIELLDKFDTLNPDVILMDVMMPQMSGYDVCHAIKQDANRKHTPIILVTALNGREDVIKGLESGADEFLSKPVNGSELRARVRTMLRIKNQYDSMQTLMQLREDLAQMLIHDMRNPLTVATLYNNIMLRRDQLPPRDREYALQLRDSLRQLTGFLDEILTVARMEQGMLKLDRSPEDVNKLLTTVAKSHQDLAQLQGVALLLDLPETHSLVPLDAPLFKRVMDNLLSNAFKYAPENSQVTVRLRYRMEDDTAVHPTTRLCLQVIDEGPGIAPENYERIFNKFEVVALKKAGQVQVGLGLAFCKLVVEAHGGCIFASSNSPTGAIFTIEL